jgi:hypothetical protein
MNFEETTITLNNYGHASNKYKTIGYNNVEVVEPSGSPIDENFVKIGDVVIIRYNLCYIHNKNDRKTNHDLSLQLDGIYLVKDVVALIDDESQKRIF